MTADKVRNLTEEEIRTQERDLNDQLFRLKFQMKMGQTESLKKVRGLRKDIARIKTIARERVLSAGNGNGQPAAAPKAAKKPAERKTEAKAASKTENKAEKKTATARK
ncbi:MAG: 50S ribosomal protein L29 [Candidatus Koribacter versatilis]|uniref:Large ribosomal subunit protein uL29 n=1 Tax=Candidatus Korobacter versatilis TaxID=658062 RepID=A0A932A9R9_9BACT|nr:50S ribosomal protein L29 [Candidatus Koribacter versatilis]